MPAQDYIDIHTHLYGGPPLSALDVGESDADILSPSRGFMDGFDYTMQLMTGCPGGCAYCYVRTAPRLAPTAVRGVSGEDWGYKVRRKRNAIAKLAKHLDAGRIADRTIYWSGVTDPYASEPGVTQGVWETLLNAPAELRPKRIVVQTRYSAERDADIMARYSASQTPSDGGPAVGISYSLGTDRDDLIQAWERATLSFRSRMNALEALTAKNLYVVVTLSPMALWDDLRGVMLQLNAAGVRYITILFFKERSSTSSTPPGFLAYLRQNYSELLDPIWQQARVREVEEVFGSARVIVGQRGFASLATPHRVVPMSRVGSAVMR